ncbi:cytokine receptor common subunit beta [Pelodytes ibericus]
MENPCTDERMFFLLMMLLSVQEIQGSALLDSLNCVNDYRTHWRCQWKENKAAHSILPMNLYHWSSINSTRHRCAITETKEDGSSNLIHSCRVNSKFIIHMKDNYTFAPEKTLQREIKVIPAYKVRTLPPEGFHLRITDNGWVTLNWKRPLHSDLPLLLLYQISYYRRGLEKWEDAASLNVLNETEVSLDPQLLIPGNTYIFRIRAKPQNEQHYKGSWSMWSKQLSLNMPEDDKALPQNVQCEYNGLTEMICSWVVRAEVTLSVSYALYYSEHPTESDSKTSGYINNISFAREKKCVPKKSSFEANGYVSYSCTLLVPQDRAHSIFNIQIRPQEEEKSLTPSKNIQTQPPTNLRAEEQSDYSFNLRWDPPVLALENIKLAHQLCYWKEGEPECPVNLLLNVSGNLPEYYIPKSCLQVSTVYTAKVRTRPDLNQPNYSGPWSDWSSSTSWNTKKSITNLSLYIIASVSAIVILIVIFPAYGCVKSLKNNWENSLPNPSKSKLLSTDPMGYWRLNISTMINNYYPEDEIPSICIPGRHVDTSQIRTDTEESVEGSQPKPDDLGSPENNFQSNPSMEALPGTSKIVAVEPLHSSAEQQSKKDNNCPKHMFSCANSLLSLENNVKKAGYFTLPRFQVELLGSPNEVTPSSKPVEHGEQRGYVLGMGADNPPQPSPPKMEKQSSAKCGSYTPLPLPSDIQVPTEGPLMIINPDGTGPLMLRQVGDYCYFPGLLGSQEKLEMKVAPTKEGTDRKILQDPPQMAVHNFKVMQSGYFALPQT